MNYASLIYQVADGIATVRLNDPDRLNALTFETYAELERLFAAMASDSTVKVIVLTGTGKGFCSGGSVHEIIGKLIEMNPEEQQRFTRLTCDVVKNMRGLKKPIVAAVNGIAAGAGAVLSSRKRHSDAFGSRKVRLSFHQSGAVGRRYGRVLSAAADCRPR